MKKLLYCISLAAVFAACIFTGALQTVQEDNMQVKETASSYETDAEKSDEGYLFRLKDGAVPADNSVVRYLGNSTYWAETQEDIYKAADPADIEYTEESFTVSMLSYSPSPDDRYYSRYQSNLRAMEVPYAWEHDLYGSGVTVAVIDSGIAYGHEDIDYSHVLKGKNYISPKLPAEDGKGHGTFVSGIIMASQNNGLGIAGIAPDVYLLPMKVFDNSGNAYGDSVIQAVYDAADMGADVINMSMGTDQYSKSFRDACNYAVSKGCIIVAAAGNKGKTDKVYPAAFTGVIAVGSTDKDGNLSGFSQRGNWIYVTAPGENLAGLYKRGYKENQEGTSFSAPEVAALAAICKSVDRNIDTDGFKLLLRQTSINTTAGRNSLYGYGRVSFRNAVNVLLGITEEIDESCISLEYDRTPYSGKAKKPAVTVTCGGVKLREGLDYSFTYSDNTKIGTAQVTVKGKGMYSGTAVRTFVIYDTVVVGESVTEEGSPSVLSDETMKHIAASLEEGCETVIRTENMDIVLDADFLKAVCGYPLTIESEDVSVKADEDALKVLCESISGDIRVCVSEDGTFSVTESGGAAADPSWMKAGTVTAGIRISDKQTGVKMCVRDDKGAVYSVKKKNGKVYFTVSGYGTYRAAECAQAAKSLVKSMKVSVTSSSGKIKASADVSSYAKMGYTVKYSYYRSTKKNSGYTRIGQTSQRVYMDRGAKKGVTYYCKVRVMIYDGGKYVTGTALSKCAPCRIRY